MAETISDEWRKARKPHRCIWCGEAIVIGETYRHWRGKWEGEVMSNDWHKECDAAAANSDAELEGFEPYSFARGSQEERTQFTTPRNRIACASSTSN
jgi:hypothetical protein